MSEEKVFELNPFEKMCVNACFCGDYMVMGSSFIDSSDLNQELDQDLVKKGLIILQRRHPFLNAYLDIEKRKENVIFIKIKNELQPDKIQLDWLDLRNENVTRDRLNNESAKYDSIMFEIDKNQNLLWRTQVISYLEDDRLKYLINLVIHIAITDGINITTLSIELVNIINALIDKTECDEMKVRLEPIEDLYTLVKKHNLYKDEFMDTVKRISSQEKAKFVLPDLFKSTNEVGFNLDLFCLDLETTQQMLKKSKLKNVRLTGYFYTASLYALKKLYLENKVQFPDQITLELPASLRVRYNPILDFSHCRLQTVMVLFSTDKREFNNFWSDAFYIHGLIQENTSIETGTLFSMTHDPNLDLFNQVFSQAETNQEAMNILSKDVHCDLAVSNLGAFVSDKVKVYQGKFEINELYCTDPLNSKPSIAPGIVIHLFYWKQKLMIELGANKSCLGTPYFQRYKQLLIETINETINF